MASFDIPEGENGQISQQARNNLQPIWDDINSVSGGGGF